MTDVTEGSQKVDLVRHHKGCEVLFPSDSLYQAHEFNLVIDIQICSEFVQEQYLRLLG